MKRLISLCLIAFLATIVAGQAAVITVNSEDSTTSPPAGQTNLWRAITLLQDGDTINFNISGLGVHYLVPPVGGFPMITNHNVTIDGYSQPGSSPNTNTFLTTNNAKLTIVLTATNFLEFDSRWQGMDYNSSTNDKVGYTPGGEFALLGVYGANNLEIKGLCFLGCLGSGTAHYALAFARDMAHPCNGSHVSGCWLGVAPDGNTTYPFDTVMTLFSHKSEASYRFRGTNGATVCGYDVTINNSSPTTKESDRDIISNFNATNTCAATNPTVTINESSVRFVYSNHVFGVKTSAHDPTGLVPRAQQNIFIGGTIGIAAEGQAFKFAGNRIGVYPDGMRDYITPFVIPGSIMEGVFEIGRGASDNIIGTDGDGNNDAEERNIFGGVVTDGDGGNRNLNGYTHTMEFYSASGSPGKDRKDNRIAGNYIGVAVDGVTRFTNGVPFCNGSTTGASQYWIGSDFDGVSDDIEANVIYNNYSGNPATTLFYDTIYTNSVQGGGGSQGFMDQVGSSAIVSLRGNKTINNYPFPVNPGQAGFLTTYVTKAMATPLTASNAILSASSTAARIRGTVPVGKLPYKYTILDFYLADPEGLTNGIVVPLAVLPNGWVQGSKYLGSFTVATTNINQPPNLSSTAGQFELNTCSLGITNGSTITVTANYSQDPPLITHNARVLTTPFSPPLIVSAGVVITSVSRSGNTVSIAWCGGVAPYKLQRKLSLTDATWTDIQTGIAGTSTTDSNANDSSVYRVVGLSN